MKKIGKVAITFGVVLLMCAMTFVLAAVAYASQPQKLKTALVKGPVATFASGETVSSTATCPTGLVVTGGSFDLSVTSPGTTALNSMAESQTSPTTWTVTDSSGAGGQSGTITAVAVCSSAQDHKLKTALAKGPVTTFASGATVSSTATCPTGLVVTGGSFEISITSPGTAAALSHTQTQTSPTTWTVTTISGAGGQGGTITAVAVCSSVKNKQLETTLAKGPVTAFTPGTTVSSTATCPTGQVVTGGSLDISETSAVPSAPPLASITGSQTSPTTWTITFASGGVGGAVTAVAVCSSLS